MKKLLKICVFTITVFCASLIFNQSNGEEVPNVKKNVIVDPSYSLENPMELKKIKEIYKVKYAQEDYIKEHYGEDYRITLSLLMLDEKGRFINSVFIESDNNDKAIAISFDVSNAMKEFSKKNKDKFKKIVGDLKEGAMTTNNVMNNW